MLSSVTLDGHFAHFVQAQLSAGRYADANEVVRDALRLMERRDFAQVQLYAAFDESIADIEAGRVHDLHEACDEIIAEIEALPDGTK